MSGDSGWLAVGSADRKVKLWNLKKNGHAGGFREKHEPSALAFSPDGNVIAVAGENRLKLWSVRKEREVQSFASAGAGALAFSRDGHCLALSKTPSGVHLMDTVKSHELAAIPSHAARALAVNQNGTVAIASDGAAISIWR